MGTVALVGTHTVLAKVLDHSTLSMHGLMLSLINKYRCHAGDKACLLLRPATWQGRDPRFMMCLLQVSSLTWDIVERATVKGSDHRAGVSSGR